MRSLPLTQDTVGPVARGHPWVYPDGVRGRAAVDFRALEALLVRFSRLTVEQRFIKEIEINPLRALDRGAIALDVRLIL